MNINLRFREVKENSLELLKCQDRDLFLKQEVKSIEIEMEKLREQMEKEQKDIGKLEGIGFTAFLAKLKGDMNEKLDKEQKEYILAKNTYDTTQTSLEKIQEEIVRNEQRIQKLLPSLAEYKELMIEKTQELTIKADDKQVYAYEIKELKRNGIISKIREINEAIEAGERILEEIIIAAGCLEKAQQWGSFDMWSRSWFASIAKHEHLDHVKASLDKLPVLINHFNKELKDVSVESIGMNMQAIKNNKMFDIWFDNIFTDLSIQNKIQSIIDEITDLNIRIQDTLDHMEIEKSNLENELLIVDAEIDHLIEGYEL